MTSPSHSIWGSKYKFKRQDEWFMSGATLLLFGEIRQPESKYVLVPRHSSENRTYVPMAFFMPDFIVSDSCMAVPNATLYHFGVLISMMHMTWMRQVCGRIKSDYRYSAKLVYNNFPWPDNPSQAKIERVEQAAQKVLDTREKFQSKGSSLADLYDPLVMPRELVQAHNKLLEFCDRRG